MRHCTKRRIFVATAERICWRCVFLRPIYRDLRKPVLRVVCEKVPESPRSTMIHMLKLLRQVDAHEPLARVHDALEGNVASCFVPSSVHRCIFLVEGTLDRSVWERRFGPQILPERLGSDTKHCSAVLADRSLVAGASQCGIARHPMLQECELAN